MALFYKKKNWQPADAKLRLIVARTYKELGKISEKVNVLVHLCCKFIFPKKIYPGVITWPSDIFSVPCFYFSHFFFILYSGRHDLALRHLQRAVLLRPGFLFFEKIGFARISFYFVFFLDFSPLTASTTLVFVVFVPFF